MKTFQSSVVLLAAGLSTLASAQVIEKKSLNMDGAHRVIAAAVTEAHNKKTTGVIAVVDDGGNLMALERRKTRGKILRHTAPGVLHERQAGNAVPLSGYAVDALHLGCQQRKQLTDAVFCPSPLDQGATGFTRKLMAIPGN